MQMIETTAQLRAFCESLAGSTYVTVDTEFMREKTYWSKLCLIQVAGAASAALIDPLAADIDLSPLYDILYNPQIIKVFHAARQDVEIFVHATGRVPEPLFDTQVAAMVCGFGEAASYETLVDQLAHARVDKSSRFTDWSYRPLTPKQMDYALADVTHLRVVYEKLKQRLEQSGRMDWVAEEMASLVDLRTYNTDPMDVWKRLKIRADKPRLRAYVRAIAAWRENEARRLNVPRGRVFKDETLMEIAHHAPQSVDALARTRGLSQSMAEGRQGAEILAAIHDVQAMDPKDYPAGEEKKPHRGAAALLDLLRVLLKHVSDEEGVAARLIASADDLERLATEDEPAIKTLTGWRRQIFGDVALALKRGELALSAKNRKIRLIKTTA